MNEYKIPERIKVQVNYDVLGIEDIMILEPTLRLSGDYTRTLFLAYNRSRSEDEKKSGYYASDNDNQDAKDLRRNGFVLSFGAETARLEWGAGYPKPGIYRKIKDQTWTTLFDPKNMKVVRNLEYVLLEVLSDNRPGEPLFCRE